MGEIQVKGFDFTKEDYISILESTAEIISKIMDDEEMEDKQFAEFFGIYYNAIAGCIRSGGVMYEKVMDEDGYAKIIVHINGHEYSCKDNAIRDIFRNDYEKIMHPFQDTSNSYVKVFVPDIILSENDSVPEEKGVKKSASILSSLLPTKSTKQKDDNKKEDKDNKKKEKEPKPKKERHATKKAPAYEEGTPEFYYAKINKITNDYKDITGNIEAKLIGIGVAVAGIIASLFIF